MKTYTNGFNNIEVIETGKSFKITIYPVPTEKNIEKWSKIGMTVEDFKKEKRAANLDALYRALDGYSEIA